MNLRQLFEEPRTAVMAFGRMNPPTIGHAKLVDAIKSQQGDHYLFLSQSQKPKTDPLAFEDKLRYAKFFFPDITVGHPEVKTIIQALKKINELGYENLVYVAGSDRVDAFEELLNKYNGGDDYSFKDIQVVSAGERDPDADGAEGMSASKMRAAAAEGDLESFKQGVPQAELADEMFAAVRKGMGVKEPEMAEGIFSEQDNVEVDPKRVEALYNAMLKHGFSRITRAMRDNYTREEYSAYMKALQAYTKQQKESVTESDVVIDPAQIREYLKMLIDDAIDKEQNIDKLIEKLSEVLKILVGKEIKSRGKRYKITSEDVVTAFEASCKNRKKKVKEAKSEELPDGSTKDYAADGSYTHSGAWGKKFYDASGKLIKTRTPVVDGLHITTFADGRKRYMYGFSGGEVRGPMTGDKPGEADFLRTSFGGTNFIFDARRSQPVIKGSITIGRMKIQFTGKVLDRPAFHKDPFRMASKILGGDIRAAMRDPRAAKPMIKKGTAKVFLDGKEIPASQIDQAVEQGL